MINSASRLSLGLLFFVFCLCADSSAGFHAGKRHQQAREDNSVGSRRCKTAGGSFAGQKQRNNAIRKRVERFL